MLDNYKFTTEANVVDFKTETAGAVMHPHTSQEIEIAHWS
jgi:hypothetical protein